MHASPRSASGTTAGAHGDLVRLMDTEQRLAAAMEEAQRRAEALRTGARETAGAMERAQDEELAALLAARAQSAGEELRREIDGLILGGRTSAGRYASLDEQATDRLAGQALQLIRESVGGTS